MKAHLALSEEVLTTLPFDREFDLIYAFSVFTHLSEKTAHAALNTLRRYIVGDGVLVITIRPKQYWHAHGHTVAEQMMAKHDHSGLAFLPHNRMPIDGDITFGDTSMSVEYIKTNFSPWRLLAKPATLSIPIRFFCSFARHDRWLAPGYVRPDSFRLNRTACAFQTKPHLLSTERVLFRRCASCSRRDASFFRPNRHFLTHKRGSSMTRNCLKFAVSLASGNQPRRVGLNGR